LKKNIKNIIVFSFTSFIGLILLTNSISASSSTSSSTSDGVAASFLGLYFSVVLVYYCFICLYFLALCVHAILCIVTIIDISKRLNNELSKDTWILLILLPSVIPLINYIGIFVSVSVELYYLISYRNQLEETKNSKNQVQE
jgi:hypothetical protein